MKRGKGETKAKNVMDMSKLKPVETINGVIVPHTQKFDFRSSTKNASLRKAYAIKDLAERKKMKKERRDERKELGLPPGIPHTLETLRIPDPTVLKPEMPLFTDRVEEVEMDIKTDDYSNYDNKEYVPKIIITCSDYPAKFSKMLGKALQTIIPNSVFRLRKKAPLKRIIAEAIKRKFSDLVVINQNRDRPNGLLISHLPEGPTVYFRMYSVKNIVDLKRHIKEINSSRPEVILSNFTTRLGIRVSRILGGLFHYDPEYRGKQVATFHNQRDYIFFRFHRYHFNENAKALLRELGPRFTLRLEYIHEGTFNSKYGEYEFIKEGRRRQLEKNRRQFNL